MAKKLVVLASILAVSLSVLHAQTVVTATWNPSGSGNDLWSDAASWSTSLVPDTNTFADVSSAIPCVVDATAGTAVCYRMNVADGSGSSGTLIVTNGGVLAPAYDYCAIGYSGNGALDVENGCSVSFPSHLWIGFNTNATGDFILNGGTVNVSGNFGLGFSGGTGFAHINGGTLNLNQINAGPGASGVGINNLSTMDITEGTVNITNVQASTMSAYVSAGRLTAYGGSGTVIISSFGGNGVTITAVTNNSGSSGSFPQVIVPTLNTNEIVVAAATPQEFGAVADGVTDDSAAFQNAMNAVYNSGGPGGGVVYVPAGNYAFSNTITIPTGVTLQGDWQDWTKGTNGCVGTTLKVFTGAGSTNNTPFIAMDQNAAIKDLNIWYPNQNPNSLTPYPYTISLDGNNDVIQNVALVNSYLGIQAVGQTEWILSTVVGTPLSIGLYADSIADICHTEGVRFNPNIWANSGLTNAPTAGGSYAAWMMANGTGMQIYRLDGLININTMISGYNLGLDFEQDANGSSGCAYYNSVITNCNIAVNAIAEQSAGGLEFSDCTLEGGTALSNTSTNDSTVHCSDCTLIGLNGTAVNNNGNSWESVMAFQNCTISNMLSQAGPGVLNLVNCSLLGSTQCVLSASATRGAFTGCTFSPSQDIVNNGNAGNLLIDLRRSSQTAMPMLDWTNVQNRYAACQPAKAALYVATSYGATGNGTTDDTAAIQSALTAAGSNGGGIVYLPAGNYHTTNTLSVPSGVELRGTYELRHGTWGGADGIEKGSIIDPYGGRGETNGPPAVALAANSGLVGVTFNYPQQSNNVAFPPTIQGQGGNVYVIGVQCAEPWNYVDLDTYTCTNHFLYMVDGWALNSWVRAGNGSSGMIVDTHGNPTYWIDNPSGQNQMINEDAEYDFGETNMQTYVLGDCQETFVKDFVYGQLNFMYCYSENGIGPNVTAISAACDGSYQSYVFNASGPCTLTNVNSIWWCAFNPGVGNWNDAAAVVTTTNFQGTARFLNVPLWGGSPSDYDIGGGDVGLELVQLPQAAAGVEVTGGVFHLINASIENSDSFSLRLGPNSGMAGKTNELIGCFDYGGWNVPDNNVANPANVWMDYDVYNYNVLDLGPVIIGNIYPDGIYQFEPSSVLSFTAYSPYGINPSGISVALTQTNLLGQGRSMTYTTANGLVVSGTNVISVTAPLVTNMVYNAIIQVTDADGNAATNSLSFDTVNPAMTFEAEDFDYNGGDYLINPAPDAYAGLSGISGIDYSNGIIGQGSASYRPQGLETEVDGDQPRASYDGLSDYDVGFANVGNWGNYSRAFPAGSYYVCIRIASPNAPQTQVIGLSQVTGGWGTSSQTTTNLGTFSYQDTGSWQTYVWMPLLASNGQPFVFQGGSTETLRATELKTGYNINYYMLVSTNSQLVPPQGPVMLQVSGQPSSNASSLAIVWPGNISDIVTNLYWTPSLTPPITWTRLTNAPVYTNGQWTVTLPMGTNSAGFYRLQ